MKINKNKILLVIGGGVSAYKTLDLIRLLKKNNFEIKTILTRSGKKFVTPMSIISLSGGKVYEDIFDKNNETEIDHISLSRWADLIVVVPTTANLLSKLTHGRAEDLATTVMLASNKDIILVPAMNVRMWDHKATQNNCKTLVGYGYKFIGPNEGSMACGEYGKGKMSSPSQIFKEIKNYFNKKNFVKKKNFTAIVTTGPTREYIDPIRFISNESSGRQGYEIALALNRQGIKTTLIAGPTDLQKVKGLKLIRVKTSEEMFKAVKKNLPTDVAIFTAAVTDFKPTKYEKNKIKKESFQENLRIKKTEDILDYVGKNNLYRPKLVIGFSAETENLIRNSKIKLRNKNSDWIIANDVSKKDTGINKEYNEVKIIESNGKIFKINKNKKSFIASVIADRIVKKLLVHDKNLN
tara:strand:+ start:4851 stop:6077 length:1227 start_codon:yes stop_codon:yes gene_type:complete